MGLWGQPIAGVGMRPEGGLRRGGGWVWALGGHHTLKPTNRIARDYHSFVYAYVYL